MSFVYPARGHSCLLDCDCLQSESSILPSLQSHVSAIEALCIGRAERLTLIYIQLIRSNNGKRSRNARRGTVEFAIVCIHVARTLSSPFHLWIAEVVTGLNRQGADMAVVLSVLECRQGCSIVIAH